MKNILMVLLVLSFINCKAQDTIQLINKTFGDSTGMIKAVDANGTVYKLPNTLPTMQPTIKYGEFIESKPDTIKVIMLVCDTAQNLIADNFFWINDNAKWEIGYSVREKVIEYIQSPSYKNLYYLDKDKKRLPDNIIVWDAKEIK